MKAIETVYNGYRFRSRLEARWAVFFDTLGVKYEYEKEGYDLDFARYLPDFWLPVQGCWIEIKGESPTQDEIERMKSLTKFTGKRGYILWGSIPTNAFADPYDRMWECYKDGEYHDQGMIWTACPKCRAVGLAFSGYSRDLQCSCDVNKESDDDRIEAAYTAARQARFEFGETPIPSPQRVEPAQLPRVSKTPPVLASFIVPLGADEVNVAYDPAKVIYDPSKGIDTLHLNTVPDHEQTADILSGIIYSWDVCEDDGVTLVPIEAKRMKELPRAFLLTVLEGIIRHVGQSRILTLQYPKKVQA